MHQLQRTGAAAAPAPAGPPPPWMRLHGEQPVLDAEYRVIDEPPKPPRLQTPAVAGLPPMKS